MTNAVKTRVRYTLHLIDTVAHLLKYMYHGVLQLKRHIGCNREVVWYVCKLHVKSYEKMIDNACFRNIAAFLVMGEDDHPNSYLLYLCLNTHRAKNVPVHRVQECTHSTQIVHRVL